MPCHQMVEFDMIDNSIYERLVSSRAFHEYLSTFKSTCELHFCAQLKTIGFHRALTPATRKPCRSFILGASSFNCNFCGDDLT